MTSTADHSPSHPFALASSAVDADEGPRDVGLVLSDVVMPVMNGVVLARELRARYPALPVAFTSGHTHRALVDGAALPHGVPLLRKPWTVDELVGFVRTTLRR